jgi:hypothetical protein
MIEVSLLAKIVCNMNSNIKRPSGKPYKVIDSRGISASQEHN